VRALRVDHAVVKSRPRASHEALDLIRLKADEAREGDGIHLPHEEVYVIILCAREEVVSCI